MNNEINDLYLSRNSFLEKIDKLEIYEKDYDILLSLLSTNNNFFTKILEEILLGNLYISDFDRVFKDDAYANILERNFKEEERIERETAMYYEFNKKASNLISTEVKKNTALYKKLKAEDREALFYEIFSRSDNDDALSRLAKINLFTAISNYKYLESKGLNDKEKASNFEYISNGKIRYNTGEKDSNGNIIYEEYSVINPDDILFYKNDPVITCSWKDQILNLADRDFMIENNISENQMKKIKALSISFSMAMEKLT